MRRVALTLLATVAFAAEASGQKAGSIEVGLFPNISYFDRSLHLPQAPAGPGGRIGIFFTDYLAVEGEGAWVPVDGRDPTPRVAYIPLRGKLALNLPTSEHTGLVFGAGYVHTLYRRDADGSDDGVTGSAGIRLGLGDVASVRVDTYLDYIPSPENGAGDNINWGIQPGLSFLLGGRRDSGVRDRDGDGVPDKVDECKNTPAGDRVDAKGCTVKDADGDGVLDDADQCADTPAGDQVVA
jgi:hypothetical protein